MKINDPETGGICQSLQGRDKGRDGFLIRRVAIETGVHCITAMDTANALVRSLEAAHEEMTMIDIAKIG